MTTHCAATDNDDLEPAHTTISLTRRQREVLTLVAEGLTDGEIALCLGISVETAAWHVREIRAQLKARTRAHAVALALRQGVPLEAQFAGQHP